MHLSLSPDDLRPLVEAVVAETILQLRDSLQPKTGNPEALLLDVPTAAKLLSVCPKSLWTLTDQGDLPSVRIGRRVLYDPADLKAWIAATKSISRPAPAASASHCDQ